MNILAIDSGVEKTGYAIFSKNQYVSSGLIKTSKDKTFAKRIEQIYQEVKALIKSHKIRTIVAEQLFFFRNQKTAIKVSQAQGTIILLAAQFDIPIIFLTPLQIKQIITGYGKADKKAVQKMISLTLNIPAIKQDDEADAVACGLAYCYLNQNLLQ